MSERNSLTILFLFLIATGLTAQERIAASAFGGCDSLKVTFELRNAYDITQYNSIVWNFGDGETEAGKLNVGHTYMEPGRYHVSCELDDFRTIALDDAIIVSETPVADFVFKDTVVEDEGYAYVFESRYFVPISGVELQYEWTFPGGGNSDASRPVFRFDETGIYPVTMIMTDQNGCTDTIVKNIPVADKLLVPNVFTPNNDGVNDVFMVTTPGDYNYIFRVYSRNGLQVFYSVSPIIRWDGRTNDGTEVREGIYFYTIESDETPVATSQQGFIQLYR